MLPQVQSDDERFRIRALWVVSIGLVVYLGASLGQRAMASQLSEAPIWRLMAVTGILLATFLALWFRRFGGVLARIAIYAAFLSQFYYVALHGGLTGYQFMTLLAFPPLCALLFGSRETLAFGIIFMLSIIGLAQFDAMLPAFELPADKVLPVSTMRVIATAFVTLMTLIILVRESEKRDEKLRSLLAEQHYLATHDRLTGLANRTVNNEYFVDLKQSPRPVVAYLIDLDGFKHVNDTFGHLAGDLVLKRVARSLEDVCAGSALIVRLGGDEFLVVQEISGTETSPSELGVEIVKALTQEIEFEGGQATIGASVGSARFPEDVDSPDKLLGLADVALYQAKARGKMCHVAFSAKSLIAPLQSEGVLS